jgi:hypothetical protein
LSKLQGRTWWTGEAVWGVLANFDYAPMQQGSWYTDLYTEFLVFMSRHETLNYLFITASTMFTLTFEIGFAFLVWGRRTRWIIIVMAVMLHGGIGLFMGLKTFSMMMLTLVLSFVPPESIRRLLGALARGPTGMKLHFSSQDRRAARAATIVRALDVWDQVELVDHNRWGQGTPADSGDRQPPLYLATGDGRRVAGGAMAGRLFISLGIFRIYSPWCWFRSLWWQERPTGAPDLPLQEMMGETVGMKTTTEPIKSGSRHIRKKR